MKRWAVVAGLAAQCAFADRWNVQYFYDQDRSQLVFEDLAFPSEKRGIAVGTIVEGPKRRYVSLATSDGGEHWTVDPLKDHPRSIFFLNDSMGWMVGDDAIWFSEESGRDWKKISDQRKPDKKLKPVPPDGLILRVWFIDASHGYAIGLQKTVLETRDGGKSWTPVAAAAQPESNPAHTAYTRIAFDASKYGIILGQSTPPRRDSPEPEHPAWMEPEKAVKRREIPRLTILLDTKDGGGTWRPQTAPTFGTMTALRLSVPDGLAVFGYNESFDWPAEVQRIDLTNGKSGSVFRAKDRRVIDAALFPGPRAFLAAVEPTGRLNSAPIPGKVHMLSSTNLTDWTEMDVSYKAVARSLMLSGPDPEHLWCATDTGMILHLQP